MFLLNQNANWSPLYLLLLLTVWSVVQRPKPGLHVVLPPRKKIKKATKTIVPNTNEKEKDKTTLYVNPKQFSRFLLRISI